jgi:hypothetical protein
MSKFICLCGSTYKNQKMADLHLKMYEDVDLANGYPSHKMFKQQWQARFLSWVLNYSWERFFRFVGVFMVYVVFMTHFNVHLSWIEGTVVALGLGLAID